MLYLPSNIASVSKHIYSISSPLNSYISSYKQFYLSQFYLINLCNFSGQYKILFYLLLYLGESQISAKH